MKAKQIAPVPTADDLDFGSNTQVAGVDSTRLRSFVERIERLEEERRSIADDIKQIKLEAKASGFDTPVLSFLIRERRKDKDDLDEFNSIADTYRRALG